MASYNSLEDFSQICVLIQSISRRQKKKLSDFLIINISLDNFHENKKPVIFLKSDTAAAEVL